jgi:hypothetical protein
VYSVLNVLLHGDFISAYVLNYSFISR